MKKIVSAVALASVAFGAFAADLTVKSEIKYNSPSIAQFDSTKNRSDKTYATLGASGYTNDATTIQLKSDNVEVYGKYDFKDSGLSMNVAYGIIKWGNANLTFGRLESRFSGRVTTDQNDLSLIEQNKAYSYVGETSLVKSTDSAADQLAAKARKEYTVYGTKKLGINTNVAKKWGLPGGANAAGVDADCVTDLRGSKVNSVVFDYTLNDVGPGKLLLKAVGKANAGSWSSSNDDGTSTSTNNSGFSFEAAYTHEMFKADFVANLDQAEVGSWGLYIQPTPVKELTSVLGFTYAWDQRNIASTADTYTKIETYDKNDGTGTKTTAYTLTKGTATAKHDLKAWAIDARARYAINDQLAAGIYANVTHADYKKNDKKVIDGLNSLDVVLNVNYKLNDLAKFFVEGEYAALSISEQDAKADSDNALTAIGGKYGDTSLVFQGGVILTPAKGATITGAVRAIMGGFGADSDHEYMKGTTIVIPLSFKTSL